MKKKVFVRGPALTASGYGEHARLILRALRAHEENFDIFLESINWGQTGYLIEDNEERKWLDHLCIKTQSYKTSGGTYDVAVQITIPNEWQNIAPVNIGVTAGIETTKISPQWVEKCQVVDKIIVPSNHARYAFDHTSYKLKNEQTGDEMDFINRTPIEVVHYPVKNTIPESIPLELAHDFNFLAVAQWGVRKNLENTIRWFVGEFRHEEIGLVVKASTRKNSIGDRQQCQSRLEDLLADFPDRKCKVYLVHGNMTEEEMGGLYTHPKIKAIVSATHGEGFGLPLFEAVYNELPVIAPNWGGHIDFLYAPKKDKKGKTRSRAHFTKVDYNIAPIQSQAVWEGVLQKDSQWCFPKENSFRNALREVYKNYGVHKSESKKLAKHIKETFTLRDTYKKIVSVISGEEIAEFDMDDIPKISIITSMYKGDDFIEPFLEDITQQTIFKDKCELIIVDANSPGNEKEKIDKYLEKYPENIKYYRLGKDPGIYGTWNWAIERSTGEFITNANLDDRKSILSLEKHAKELVLNPDVDLVYADSFITHQPNETFDKNSSGGKKYNFEHFSKEAMLRGNQAHNNPMWRKSAHADHGLFNDKYKSAGDWEFFLRCAFGGSQFKKIDTALGLYYFNPQGISTNIENDSWKREEEKEIYMKYKKLAEEEKKGGIIL